MPAQTLYLWKQAPFLRLLIPLIAGIILQWYCNLPVQPAWWLLMAAITAMVLFNYRLSFLQYRFGWLNGMFINTMFLSIGILMCWYANMKHQQTWIGNDYRPNDAMVVTLQEPLSAKPNSFKANASVELRLRGDTSLPAQGNIILYFSKETDTAALHYGTQLVFNKPLHPIKNSGNPGSFNYERYAAFHGISHQVYLQPADVVLLRGNNGEALTRFLYATRDRLLLILSGYIPGKKEAGMAEALLVGYKDDLDKTLVQSYSNTGVVHVIAISGMHLGLIYWLLAMLTAPLKKKRPTKWMAPVTVIAGLWLFALLTGGGPSIMRSAVMFTCIVIGESIERKTFIYNSLAASAFILLTINPFWLWDAGFQLSYTAVLSIVIFMKPIYNWCYFNNKLIDTIWKLTAVTIAAQVLTTPMSMYHFHQFPVYFIVTNLLAVPLSSIIVLLEIALCVVATLPAVATLAGKTLYYLIAGMNSFIEYMERLPFSLWGGMQVTVLQVLVLYALITAMACWLTFKYKPACITALVCLFVFLCLRSYSFIMAERRHQLVIYNVPKRQAIDFISGRKYFFKGDAYLPAEMQALDYQVAPSRILYRATAADSLQNLWYDSPVYLFNNKTIVIPDSPYNNVTATEKITADVIILSKNAPVQLAALLEVFNCNLVVFDASNSAAKVHKWKAEAANLGLPCFSVVDNGAFVMNMD